MSPIAARRYSAGRIFLDVVPSFRGVIREVRQEAKKLRDEVAKDDLADADKQAKAEANTRIREAKRSADEESKARIAAARAVSKEQLRIDREGVKQFQKTIQAQARERLQAARRQAKDEELALRNLARASQAARAQMAKDAERQRRAEERALQNFAKAQMAAREAIRKKAEREAREQARAEAAAAAAASREAERQRLVQMRWAMKERKRELDRQAKIEAKHYRERGGRFGQELRDTISKALLDLAPATINVDATPAHAELAMVAQRLRQLGDAEIGVDIDARTAMRELQSIERQANKLDRRGISLDVRTNAKSTMMVLRDYRKEIANVSKATGVLSDRHNRSRERALDAANAFRLFNGVLVAAMLFVPLLVPAIAGLAAVLGGLIPLLLGAAAGAGSMVLGFLGIGDAVKALSDVNKNAAKDALQATKTMRNAAKTVRDAEQGVATAREQAARATRDASRQVADAEEALADARESAARRAEDAAKRVAEARRDQVEAERRAAESIERALDQQVRAEKRLEDAQRRAQEAQLDLVDARKKAQEQLEDLQSRVLSGQLAEREAELSLKDAQRRMIIAMRDPNATATDRERAQIDLERAKLDLNDLRRENRRLQEEQKDANARGVEGSERVVDARQDVIDSLEAEQEANKDLAEANKDLADTRIEAARTIADAEEKVTEALRDQRDVAKQNARAVRDAQRALTDAIVGQREAALDSARAVRDANERLTDAQAAYQEALEQTSVIGSSSMQKLKEAMDNLSPAGQRFARQLYALAPLWDRLRFASQEAMLPGAGRAVATLTQPRVARGVEGFITKTAGAGGNIMEAAAKDLTGKDWAPFFEMLDRVAVPAMEIMARIGRNLALTLGNLGVAFEDFGLSLGQGLVDLTQGWVDWSANLKKSEGFQTFMEYVERVGPKVLDLLVAFGAALINIGIALAPWAETITDVFTSIFNWIAEMDPQTLGMILGLVIGLVMAIQVAAGVMSTFSTMAMFFSRTSAGAFANPLALWALGFVALVAVIVLLISYFPGLVDWFKENWKWVTAIAAAVVGAYLAYQAFTTILMWSRTVLFLYRAGLLGVAAAQALAFAKIILIIAIIAALVAAVIWAWNNLDWFRKAVLTVWDSIQKAFAWLVEWFQRDAMPVLVDAWGRMQVIAQEVFGYLIDVVWPAVQRAWSDLVTAMIYVWDNWLSPVITDIWEMVTKVFTWIAKNIFPMVLTAFDIVATGFRIAWKMVIWPALQALWGFAVDLWENGLRPVFGFIGGGLKVLGDFFTDFWKNGVKPALEKVGEVVNWVWEKVISPVFNSIKDALHAVEDAFDSGAGFIESIWAGITEAIGGPVRAVLQWIKDNFVDPLNRMLGDIGISWQIPFFDIPNVLRYTPRSKSNVNRGARQGTASKINKSYANTGGIWGVLPGYNPGFDNLKFTSPIGELHLSGGEGILRPEVTRVLGKSTIDAMNGAAIAGGETEVARKLAGFASGGTIDFEKLPKKKLEQRGHDINPPEDRGFWGTLWDGVMGAVENVGEFVADPIGKMADIISGVLDHMPFPMALPFEMMRGIFSNVAGEAGKLISNLLGGGLEGAPPGAPGGPGAKGGAMGMLKQIALVKNMFPGIDVSSSLRPGAMTASGYVSYHSKSRAVDFTGSRSDMERLYRYLVATYGGESPEIYFGPGGWATRFGKQVFLEGVTAATHPFNHVHWAHALGGVFNPFGGDVGVYDQGGMLGPRDLAVNLGSRPEAVLTPDQSDALQRAAEFGFGGGGGVTYAPQLTSIQGASAEEVLEEFDWATKRLEREHRYGRRP